MRHLLLLIALLTLACQPARDPYGPVGQRTAAGVGVSGVHLSPAELDSIDARVAAQWECANRVAVEETTTKTGVVCPPTGVRPTRKVTRVHIEPTCSIEVSGYSRPQQGTVHRGVIRLARNTRALQHEASFVVGTGHSHAACSPTILCEHAGPPALPTVCTGRLMDASCGLSER